MRCPKCTSIEDKVIEKSGAWFSYKGERLGQGRENAKQTLRDNPELLQRVETEVKVALGFPVRAAATEEAETSEASEKATRKAAK